MAEHRILPLLLLTLILVAADSATFPGDRSALLLLARSIGADASRGWNASSDPCSDWAPDVGCDSSGHVTRVQIKNLDVAPRSGPLPPEIANLTSLVKLELPRLSLTGPLPSLSPLSSLQVLFLHGNLFDSVPAGFFSGLDSLVSAFLDDNPFAPWPIDASLKSCTRLQQFSARNASVTGPLPDFLGDLPSLQLLHLSNNLLSGGIPPSFATSRIADLSLNNQRGSRLSGGIGVVSNMTSLSVLNLQSNSFSGPLPDFSQLTGLRTLSLRDNSFTGPVPESLTRLGTLKSVVLTNNLLQGPAPRFADGVELDVDAKSESFCHDSPDSCDPRVEVLLSVAASVGYPVAFAENWKGNDPCAQWTGIGCDRDGSIVTVNFKRQNLTGVISPDFEKLEALVNLDLSDNRLLGIIPPGLANLKSLKKLDVSNNDLSGPVPSFGNGATVKTDGNPNIRKGVPPDTTPSGGSTAGSPPGSSDSGEEGGGGGKKSSVGVIVGSVCGGIVVLGVVGLLIFCFWKKKQRNYCRPPSMVIHPDHSGFDTEMLKLTMNGCVANPNLPQDNVHVVEPVNMVIKMELLREVTNNFSPDNILGRGGFGTVYGGQLHDGTLIAVKRMEAAAMGSKGTNEFKSEISVLTKVRHRHLVSLLGYCLEGNEKILVYEYMPQGTLSRHLFGWSKAGLKPLEWMRRLSIALDVARGVEYLHSLANQTFIHRDLKPSNILLGDDMRAKVADFGLVRLAPEGKHCSVETRLAGTFGYLAPEYAVTGRVTTKADVFSFGVILMELVTGRKALDESQAEENVHLVSWFRRMYHNNETFPQAIDPTIDIADKETLSSVLIVSELAGHCCARDPHQRPDMGYAVNIISSLVEHWKPSECDQNDDGYGIDLNLTLQQAVSQWQASDGGSQAGSDHLLLRYGGSDEDTTQNSIPTLPGGFASETYSGR
ncbi:putative receptor protein kinase TMK1 [Iris pallida]|uniref:non-specific serine/threonine protein kinase n=1 Tax=Iris pallida TaxID=29817 RepID=A0AAX6H4W0_IRIPA|nr:putative receptor protein kinase TMK1 [Iris pallida]